MSAGYTLEGLCASALRAATRTNAVSRVYVSTRGNDDTGNGTILRPLRTLEFLESLIPDSCSHEITVCLDRGAHTLPSRGWFLRSRLYSAQLRFVADRSWDPSAFTVLAAGVALAGTTSNTIKTAGLAIDQVYGRTLHLTHAGTTYRRTIRNNTATDIVPVLPIASAAPGDTFEVLQSNVRLVIPTHATPLDAYVFCADSPAASVPFSERLGGIQLDGVVLENPADSNVASLGFGATTLQCLDVEVDAVDTHGALTLNHTQLLAGTGFAGSSAIHVDEGAGLYSLAAGYLLALSSARVLGYIVASDFGYSDQLSFAELYGGRFFRIFTPFAISMRLGGNPGCPIQLSPQGGSTAVRIGAQTQLQLDYVELVGANAGDGFEILDGLCVISEFVTGAPASGVAVRVGYGQGRVLVQAATGAPIQYGGAGVDWVVAGGTGVNKSFFVAEGDAILSGIDASVIVRVLSST